MTDQTARLRTIALAAFCSLVLAACTPDSEDDYCNHHYLYHADHQDQVGTFTANLDAGGQLLVTVELPGQSLASQLLQNPGNVYQVSSETACSSAEVAIESIENGTRASYQSDCGSDNRVEQINVGLFDNLASLEEVEVVITTPAAQKHFAISRQCDAAIFRLQDHRKAP